MKQLMRVALALALVVAAWPFDRQVACADPTNQGVAWATDDYDAVPFTRQDAVGAAGVVAEALLLNLTHPMVLDAVAVGAVIGWGAWRTAKYRPQDAKDRIHAALAARPEPPTPMMGTLGWRPE